MVLYPGSRLSGDHAVTECGEGGFCRHKPSPFADQNASQGKGVSDFGRGGRGAESLSVQNLYKDRPIFQSPNQYHFPHLLQHHRSRHSTINILEVHHFLKHHTTRCRSSRSSPSWPSPRSAPLPYSTPAAASPAVIATPVPTSPARRSIPPASSSPQAALPTAPASAFEPINLQISSVRKGMLV